MGPTYLFALCFSYWPIAKNGSGFDSVLGKNRHNEMWFTRKPVYTTVRSYQRMKDKPDPNGGFWSLIQKTAPLLSVFDRANLRKS